MSEGMLLAVTVLAALALACFSARRLTLLVAATLPARRPTVPRAAPLPSILLLIPARDEGPSVSATLEAVDRLSYPRESLFVAAMDDASSDDTGARLDSWAEGRNRTLVIHLAKQAGKSGALTAAIAAGPGSDLIAVCDADLRPHSDWLWELAAAFEDEHVGAAAAFLRPRNAAAGPVARYAALETWTHQLVTSAGKDRLRLNPPLLGASAYRRRALESIGGFRPGGPGEDIHATVALTAEGWRTRFVVDAVADNTLVESVGAYWHQHIRWGRNLFTAGEAGAESPAPARREASERRSPSLALRAESRIARTGYADRIAFGGAAVLAATGSLTVWLPAGYLAVAVGEAAVAAILAGQGARAAWFLVAGVALFPLDVAASLAAAGAQLARRPRSWQAARRAGRVPEAVDDTPI